MTTAPTEPPALAMSPKPSTWPTVIGIIAIVFASLAIFQNGICAPIGLLGAGLVSSMMEEMAQSDQASGMEVSVAQMGSLQAYLPYTLALSLAAAAVAVVLLVGGIQLVKRRCKSRTTITVWAVLKMALALPLGYLNYLSNRAQFEAMAQAAAEDPAAPGQVPVGFFNALESLGSVGAVILIVWLWALPIFMLIWFARRPVQEEVRSWATAPVPSGGWQQP